MEVQRGSVGLGNVLDVQRDQPHAPRYHAEIKERWFLDHARPLQGELVAMPKPYVARFPKTSPLVETPC